METVDAITIEENYLRWQGSIIYTFEGNGTLIPANDVLVDKSDCGYILTFPHVKSNGIIGFALSRETFPTIIINEEVIQTFRNSAYYYKQNGYLLKDGFVNQYCVNACSQPIVHFVRDAQTYSWSTPSECVISLYYDNYKPYVRFECIAYKNHQFFLDASSHYSVNCQRYPIDRPQALLNRYSGKHHVKRSLLSGALPKESPNKPDMAIKQTQDIQRELKYHDIESVLIGGLARRLNGIIVDVVDIDLMMKDIDQFKRASQIVSNFADEIQETDKNKKFLLSNVEIDLSYDNFHVLPGFSFIIQRHDISYLSLEGLWILYSTNLMQTRLEEHTTDYSHHIEDCIFSICSAMGRREYMIHPMGDYDALGERCYNLCKKNTGKILYSDTRVSQPFQAKCFLGNDVLYCSIINLGSPQKAQIVLPQITKSVQLHSLSDDATICPNMTIAKEGEFSIIETDVIQHGALLSCQL